MLREEFDRVMALFAKCSEGEIVGVEDVFKQSLAFFEHVNEQLKEGGPEEKKDALIMMGEMYRRLMETSKKLSQDTGLNEDQLAAISDNPDNFSPEQWKSVQAAKDKMAHLSEDLTQSLDQLSPGRLKSTGVTPSSKKTHGKKGKKSQWMRS